MQTYNSYILLSSPLMHSLGDDICTQLKEHHDFDMPHHKMELDTFANGELLPRISKTVRGEHVFFLPALQYPDPNVATMMMLITNDALKRASVSGITLVTPFLPYLRQDRKDHPRVPITARMIADVIGSNGLVKGLITIDMHAEQEQGFFSIPVDNLTGVKIFSEYVRQKFGDRLQNVVILAPDFGGAVRNRRLSKVLGDLPVCIFEKRRTGINQSEIVSILGESVEGKIVVIYEDMICSGGTACGVVEKVFEFGATEVHICATHGIFSKNAEERFKTKNIQVISTDSIPRSDEYYESNQWLTKVSIAPYFADAIYEATQAGGSISKLTN